MRHVNHMPAAARGGLLIGKRRLKLPRDLPGVKLWVDGDVGLSLGTWTDQSGRGNNELQATGASQGSIVAGAVNGHTSLRLDGVNDRYAAAFTLAKPVTVCMLYKSIVIGGVSSHDIVFDGNSAGSMTLISDTTPRLNIDSGGTGFSYAAAVANGTYVVLTVIVNGPSSSIRVNGTQVATGTVGATAPGGFVIGYVTDPRTANVEYQSIVLCSQVLTSGDLNWLENYMRIKGGL